MRFVGSRHRGRASRLRHPRRGRGGAPKADRVRRRCRWPRYTAPGSWRGAGAGDHGGRDWKNLFAALLAAGHQVALINPLRTRRFQDEDLKRTKTDAIDALGLARYIRSPGPMLVAAILADYPTDQAFATTAPHRLARLRHAGRHKVAVEPTRQLIEAARRSVGQHHGPAYRIQVGDICQDLDLWRRRLKERAGDIGRWLEVHEVARLLTTIDGIGPQSAARIIAELGDPGRFATPAALAAHIGVVPVLRPSNKRWPGRAGLARSPTPGWAPRSGCLSLWRCAGTRG